MAGARVTVNGDWPDEPPHVVPFHNPTLTLEELVRGREAADKALGSPARLLFVGRLDRAKGANRAVEIVRTLHERGRDIVLDVAGDGPELEAMRAVVARDGLGDVVTFHGWLSRGALEPFYAAPTSCCCRATPRASPRCSARRWPSASSRWPGPCRASLRPSPSSAPVGR